MAMVAMLVLALITELNDTSKPLLRPSIIVLNKLQKTATKNNDLLQQNAEILQNTTKMMKTNLRTAKNYKSILEIMRKHFLHHPATNKTPPYNKKDNKKDNEKAPSGLETPLSVSEVIPIKTWKKKDMTSTQKPFLLITNVICH